MKILKNELLKSRNDRTLQTYKNNELFVGDVWQNEVGTKSIVYFVIQPDGSKKYALLKTNGTIHLLPEQKSGFGNAERIGNVCDNEDLMKMFIEKNIIIEENKKMEEKQEKKKATKKQEEKQEKICLMAKINQIRLNWLKSGIQKEGHGRAGGGAKFDFFTPQQVTDFCLAEEAKLNLFSRFDTVRDEDGAVRYCYYEVIDIDSDEKEIVGCPFDIPAKMACSEAQKVGAAITYYNRRLAMLMYKINDNSKENVEVLEDADYTAQEIPEIPLPPVEPPKMATVEPPLPPVQNPQTQNVQIEPPRTAVIEPPIQNDKTIGQDNQPVKNDNLAGENVPNVPQVENAIPTPPPIQNIEPPKQEQQTKIVTNIEDLYS